MQRAIRPAWLLRQAEELTGSGRGQPRNADLRRATSAAYYALFHRIAPDAGNLVLPDGSDREVKHAARYLSHASIRQVCAWIGGDKPPQHLAESVRRLQADKVITSVVAAFTKLQDERVAADYDHFADFTRPGTRVLVRQARRAVDLLDQHGQGSEVRGFLGLIVLRTSIR
jgi:hypothetical protein